MSYEAQLERLLYQCGVRDLSPASLQQVPHPQAGRAGVDLWIKRLDQLHPVISGNKWFKLKYNLVQAQRLSHDCIVSFGGAWSNHIHALSLAAGLLSFKSIGVIRGEELNASSNSMLQNASGEGMKLYFVSRADYRKRNDPIYQESLKRIFGACYLIPEGGNNWPGILGAGTMVSEEEAARFDHIVLSVGTGCCLVGLRLGLPRKVRLTGISALKGAGTRGEVRDWLIRCPGATRGEWHLKGDYHCGGYGRTNKKLLDLIQLFDKEYQLPLDPVYTGKMVLGTLDLIDRGYFARGERVLMLHTGGLQGRRGYSLDCPIIKR